ncbi:IS110 family transposase [Terrabacter sp. Soil810]|uniref:IS110 family transposase n=1 Tax=Terrabacter sp. Soil810 TaxID=1736418 RepID=UPI00070CD347|nr:IS110 family transposase [Terrabacter sp. Soil810]KRF46274.1 hypothetical protein ASG96_20485 [Terrabacter sp. Soil810]
MPLLAEVLDAVVGGDTHRDTHTLELTRPTGATISTLTIDNDEEGFATVIAWIAEHAPGPRIAVGLEGTRSYGIGLSRAVQAAGLVVVEVERPKWSERRRGKSDPIDARLAASHPSPGRRLPTHAPRLVKGLRHDRQHAADHPHSPRRICRLARTSRVWRCTIPT